jgi:acetoin utilization deacetylase AcuC-like enzyme
MLSASKSFYWNKSCAKSLAAAKAPVSLKIISTEKAAGYKIAGHPEHPMRVLKTLGHLKSILPASSFEEPEPAPLEAIRRVHSAGLLDTVSKEGFLDPDTPGAPGVFACSLLSAGAALRAARESLKGSAVFSLMRPPGHHATPDQGMGFCYFNSMAIAVQDLLQSGSAKKIAVVDLDCHHGNGTEAFCFGKGELLYVSLHQFPAYPGTGGQSFGNCLNYPLPPGTGAVDYFKVLEKALAQVRDFKPELIGLSMGFDTYEKDPLTQFGLKMADYQTLGRTLKTMNLPQFALLEGGYHSDLPGLVEAFLTGWDGAA